MAKEPNYWRSFEELHRQSSGKISEENSREFVDGTFDELDLEKMTAVDRRKFLGLMGASAAFAGVGCSDYRDQGVVIPYNKKPEEITIGRPNYYATTTDESYGSVPVLVKTREGRPIKINGNPDHPVVQCLASDAQASILSLYDPDRLRGPYRRKDGSATAAKWTEIDAEVKKALDAAVKNRKKLAVVMPADSSPTAQELISNFQNKYANTIVVKYDPLHSPAANKAWTQSYKGKGRPVINLEAAEILVDIDSDFLGKGRHKSEFGPQMANRRDSFKLDNFNRLYSIEGGLSLTGMNADHRLRLRPDAILGFVLALANELVVKRRIGDFASDVAIKQALAGHDLDSFANKFSLDVKVLKGLVSDLIANQGKSVLFAGEHHSKDLHVVVNFLNEVVGVRNLWSKGYDFGPTGVADSEEIVKLTNAMKAGEIDVIFHVGTNPIYHLPSGYDYAAALKKVPMKIAMTLIENETSIVSDLVLPIHHYLESWGDSHKRVGIYNLRQPVIRPLYGGRESEEGTRQWEHIFLSWVQGKYSEDAYHKFLKAYWQKNVYPQFRSSQQFSMFWNSSLHDGSVKLSVRRPNWQFNPLAFVSVAKQKFAAPKENSFAVRLSSSYHVVDGRHANNGWLQEVPHPVSKVVWDNYAAISKATAAALKVEANDYLNIVVDGRKVKLPVFIQPGTAENTVTVELGYGRVNGGTVGSDVGHNVNVLLGSNELGQFVFSDASVSKHFGTYEVVSTQAHWAFQDDVPAMLKEMTVDAHKRRKIIFEKDLEDHKKDPKWLKKEMKKKRKYVKSIYVEEHEYKEIKWGMAVDLNQCMGCMDCIVACNVENNIPVVGKEQVKNNREMHWMRIDRYYSGTAEEPEVSIQPMMCQHCDNAPCENVCPVAATVHTPDGLNGMAYNRCVGTRYCANNCPYKVRRFNFLNYRRHFRDSHQETKVASLAHNPEVSVRSRGVMEKCTWCVQRIMDARSEAKREKRQFKGSDVVTACQEGCPSNAIKFGDLNDPNSEVSRYMEHELEYKVMEELNVKPNITYMARIRNKNEEARS